MRVGTGVLCASILLAAYFASSVNGVAAETGAAWRVEKASGDVWISTGDKHQVSLSNADPVAPGQTVRTGANGMALLTRGQESMLVSPDSVIEIPTENRDGMSTTIVEKAGSLLLEVEKRNVQHFEVVTPYLAAVVKGTHFRVSVDGSGSAVQVLRGQVDVSDFKTGEQIVLLPSQEASVSASGPAQLTVTGSGLFNPVRVGSPRPQPFAPAQPAIRSASLQQPSAYSPKTGAQPASSPMMARATTANAPAPAATAATQTASGSRFTFDSEGDATEKSWASSARKMDTLSMVAVPASLGFLVTVAVAVGRGVRRKKQQNQGGGRR